MVNSPLRGVVLGACIANLSPPTYLLSRVFGQHTPQLWEMRQSTYFNYLTWFNIGIKVLLSYLLVSNTAKLGRGLQWSTISQATLSPHQLSSTLARINSRVSNHYLKCRDESADIVQTKSWSNTAGMRMCGMTLLNISSMSWHWPYVKF